MVDALEQARLEIRERVEGGGGGGRAVEKNRPIQCGATTTASMGRLHVHQM